MPEPQAQKKKSHYVGWYRKDSQSPWRKVVHGTDETDVFHRLLNALRGGDKTVLPAGTDPNAREQS